MTVDSGHVYRRYDATDPRLGRALHLDARSLAYAVERDAAAMGAPLESVLWERVLPILDQGSIGSCVGNAATGALGTAPFWDTAKYLMPNPQDAIEAEAYAVRLYSDATRVDVWRGEYPPDDTGTSGLAACKILKRRRVIGGYRWAITARGLARLLQDGPVLLGMPWHAAFFEPDGHGFIDRSDWRRSGVAGGHEVEVVGIDLDEDEFGSSVLTCCNSWGTAWGDRGRFRMHLSTYSQMHGCDVKQYVI